MAKLHHQVEKTAKPENRRAERKADSQPEVRADKLPLPPPCAKTRQDDIPAGKGASMDTVVIPVTCEDATLRDLSGDLLHLGIEPSGIEASTDSNPPSTHPEPDALAYIMARPSASGTATDTALSLFPDSLNPAAAAFVPQSASPAQAEETASAIELPETDVHSSSDNAAGKVPGKKGRMYYHHNHRPWRSDRKRGGFQTNDRLMERFFPEARDQGYQISVVHYGMVGRVHRRRELEYHWGKLRGAWCWMTQVPGTDVYLANCHNGRGGWTEVPIQEKTIRCYWQPLLPSCPIPAGFLHMRL